MTTIVTGVISALLGLYSMYKIARYFLDKRELDESNEMEL